MLVALAVLLPASEMAVGLVNYLVCRLLPPRVLPKLDFTTASRPTAATFVVIPGMLFRPEQRRPARASGWSCTTWPTRTRSCGSPC